jgi:hypothetical protein
MVFHEKNRYSCSDQKGTLFCLYAGFLVCCSAGYSLQGTSSELAVFCDVVQYRHLWIIY